MKWTVKPSTRYYWTGIHKTDIWITTLNNNLSDKRIWISEDFLHYSCFSSLSRKHLRHHFIIDYYLPTIIGGVVSVDLDDDDDIAVEEIVMNGEAIMGSEEYFNPAALCSVEITDGSVNKGKVKPHINLHNEWNQNRISSFGSAHQRFSTLYYYFIKVGYYLCLLLLRYLPEL